MEVVCLSVCAQEREREITGKCNLYNKNILLSKTAKVSFPNGLFLESADGASGSTRERERE